MSVAIAAPHDAALAATPRKTLPYLDDNDLPNDRLDHDHANDDDDEVSELTMRQFPRASQYHSNNSNTSNPSNGGMRMSSILKLPTMRLRGPTIYGWLWKQGASFKTWKKRFFLLNGATLTYYTQACVVATEVGTRCFEMPAKGGLRVADATLSERTPFGVCVTSSSGRVLYLQAGDRAARIKWLGVLQEAAKKSSSDAMIRATRVSDIAPVKKSSVSSTSSSEFADTGTSDASIQSSSMSSTRSSDDDGDGETDSDDMDPTDMKGWLHVRRRTPSMLKLFKKRYVTLVDGHLTLTSHARERRPIDKSLEIISATSWHGHEHGLKLQLEKHKQLCVYASSSEEAKRWLQAIHSNL